MRLSLAGAAACGLMLLGASSAAAETRYVAGSGADTSACTIAADPCEHIQYAVDQADSGDTIQIAAGLYPESVEVAGKALSFVGAGSGTLEDSGGATVVRGEDGTTGPGAPAFELLRGGALHSLRAEGSDGGTSTSAEFPISFGEAGGAGIQSTSEAPGQTTLDVDGVVAIGGDIGSGIPLSSGGDGLRVASGPPGAVALTAADSAFAGAESGVLSNSAGLEVSGPDSTAAVARTLFGRGATIGSETGISVSGGAEVKVESSTVDAGYGASLFGGSLSIRRSRVHGAFGGASATPSPGSEARLEVTDSTVTVTLPGSGPIAALVQSANPGSPASLTATGTTFVAQGGSAAVAVRQDEGAGPTTALLRNSVARHVPAPEDPAVDLHADRGTIRAEFSSFTSSVGENGGSAPAPGSASNLSGDPLFADPAAENYALQGTSPLIDRGDAGIVSAGQLDLAGAPRSLDGNRDCIAAPDIGAFEVVGQDAACPVAATPPVDPRPVVSAFGITNRAFAPRGGNRKRRHAGSSVRRGRKGVRRGTKFRFTLSEPTRVTIRIRQRKRDRRALEDLTSTCGEHRRGRCPRFARRATLRARRPAGRRSIAFTGRWGRKPLEPGSYVARIVAVDGAKQRSKPRRLRFRVLAG